MSSRFGVSQGRAGRGGEGPRNHRPPLAERLGQQRDKKGEDRGSGLQEQDDAHVVLGP